MNAKTVSRRCALASLLAFNLQAEVQVTVNRDPNPASGSFAFPDVRRPSRNDAATQGTWSVVDGVQDPNGAALSVLNDSSLPTGEDQPGASFFFNAGTSGGRLRLDLGRSIAIQEINSYSWHTGSRAPQVYTVYAGDGSEANFDPEPKAGTAPESRGWKLVAKVDTRPPSGPGGGQHAARISNTTGSIGSFRYLLFDISQTESNDPFGNTFFSEIDVIEAEGPAPEPVQANAPATEPILKSFETAGGAYQFTLDLTAAPDLVDWAQAELAPVVQAWYPKIVAMLPSEGYEPPARVTIRFRDNMGGTPAAAGGSTISCNAGWFRRNLTGEARGSVVHEMVHVVQQYGRGRRNNPNATRAPGWLTEGLADYIRWFLYEPESRGAEITRRNLSRARYDASYRITGNFLNWVTETHDKEIAAKLNAAAREGRYTEELWKEYTGKSLIELGEAWRKGHEDRLAAEPQPNP